MKKIIIFLILILLTGCSINDINELKFIDTIELLNTPQLICNYMETNFEYGNPGNINVVDRTLIYVYPPNPYNFWQNKIGFCLDFANFGIYAAHYHNYKTYLIKIFFKNSQCLHYLAIYKENNFYNYSSDQYYYQINASNFQDIINHYFSQPIINNNQIYNFVLDYYEVYDYNLNKIITF